MIEGPPSDGRGEVLRVGILLNGLAVENWVAASLRQVAAAPFSELVLFVINTEPPIRRSPAEKLWRNRHRLAYRLYERADARLYGRPDDAFARVDLSSAFPEVTRLEVTPLRPRPSEHRFDAGAIEAVRDARPDVLLRFGFNILRGEILSSARFGVWSFHHGDNTLYRGGPPFFWEMAEGNPVSGTILQMLTEKLDAGRVLYRSWSATDPLSLRRGRDLAYWKSAHFVTRCLREVHERGWTSVTSRADLQQPIRSEGPIYRVPTNRQTASFLARTLAGYLRRKLVRLTCREEWLLLHRPAAGPSVGSFQHAPIPIAGSWAGWARGGQRPAFRPLAPPRDRYYADPFLLADSQGTFLMFEDYRRPARRGVISCTRLGSSSAPEAALERPYHLSYPFIFTHDGRTYMIPETLEQRTIELYIAERIPDRWRLERVLMTGIAAVDSTVFHDGERFWLFAAVAENRASIQDELCLYHARDLGGSWTPHPLNPVVSDVRRARPAGALFRLGGDLIRPGQDGSRRYGSAVVFHRVDELSVDEYSETVVDRLEGSRLRGMFAAHTYNFVDGFEVIDACRQRLRALPAPRPTP